MFLLQYKTAQFTASSDIQEQENQLLYAVSTFLKYQMQEQSQ